MSEPTPEPTTQRLIRKARPEDVPAMLGFDTYASAHPERGRALQRAVEQGQCWVEVQSARVLGYVLLSHDFFDHGFVSLVVVAADQQRRGVALRLLAAAQQACLTGKLFTSTNHSNRAARALIAKAGFQPSGVVENLDPDDPELIYFKSLH